MNKNEITNNFLRTVLDESVKFGEPYDCPENCTEDEWRLTIYGLANIEKKGQNFFKETNLHEKALNFDWANIEVQRDFLEKIIEKKFF